MTHVKGMVNNNTTIYVHSGGVMYDPDMSNRLYGTNFRNKMNQNLWELKHGDIHLIIRAISIMNTWVIMMDVENPKSIQQANVIPDFDINWTKMYLFTGQNPQLPSK